MDILNVENINKCYKQKILNNISFSIVQGEVVGLVGPNGVGKTTLMKIISKLLQEDSGEIKICGVSNRDNRKKYLSNFSSIIETPALYEMLTGYDNINFIRKLNNVSKENMMKALKFINIGDNIYDKVKNYSLGMKQRLALGIALLTSPKLLILDEPTNGLDPHGVMEFRELLISLAQEKHIAILISSHILSDLDKICSKLLFLKSGEIIEFDLNNIKSNNQKIILTVENPNNVILNIKEIEGVDDVEIADNNKIYITLNINKKPQFMEEIYRRKIKYSDIEIVNDSMENLYKGVYGGK